MFPQQIFWVIKTLSSPREKIGQQYHHLLFFGIMTTSSGDRHISDTQEGSMCISASAYFHLIIPSEWVFPSKWLFEIFWTEMWAHSLFSQAYVTLHFQDILYNHALEFVIGKCRIKLHKMNFFLVLTLIFFHSVTFDCLFVAFYYSCPNDRRRGNSY